MHLKSPKDKYLNDPMYRRFVDTLEAFISSANYTPSEVREAAILACINYEMKHLRVPITDNQGVLDALETIKAFETKED